MEKMTQMNKKLIYEELEESEHQIENGQTMNAREYLEILKKKYKMQQAR